MNLGSNSFELFFGWLVPPRAARQGSLEAVSRESALAEFLLEMFHWHVVVFISRFMVCGRAACENETAWELFKRLKGLSG